MEITVVSTFPMERCGVAAYAAQTVASLRASGANVRVVTWGEGVGDVHLRCWPRGRRALDLLPHCPNDHRVILQYMPSFYIDSGSRAKELTSRLALTVLFRRLANLEVVVHEQPWFPATGKMGLFGRMLWRLERRQWSSATDLCFHNATAVLTHQQRFQLGAANTRVIQHGKDFQAFYSGSSQDARSELGLHSRAPVFVSLGFITRYKGYETVLDALKLHPNLPCEFHIVGSLHPTAPREDAAYLEHLASRASSDPRVRIHREFIDDASFDRWVRAADAVLLPYLTSTSSSVLARCHLLGTPAIVSQAAGLQAELLPNDSSVAGPAELIEALQRRIHSRTETVSGTAR